MYGMIHRAMRQMVLERLGYEDWLALEQKLGIGPPELLTGMVYEDALTQEIIAEAAVQFNLTFDECLTEFGRYWVRYADHGSFSTIMQFTGQNLASFIANLDRFHLTVGAAMPGTRLPSFTLLSSEEGHLLVQYQSERIGMEKFVYGLFLGLMDRFATFGDVTVTSREAKSVIFDIRFAEQCC